MLERIQKLKFLAENIQAAKLGKRGEEAHKNSYIVIDEYHEWRTESEDLFASYFDNSNPLFEQFFNLPRDGNGFVLMHYFDQQYPIFKVLIKKIESGQVKAIKRSTHSEIKGNMDEKSIFISHSIRDKEIVNAFVDLILHGALSVPIDKIFCISTDGTKIKSGSDWRDSINESLLSAKINFLIITPNYKESEVCQNEMGAAWVTSASVIPLIVDPVNYKTVGIIQEPNQIEKLLDEKSLDRIRDVIQKDLEIHPSLIKSDRWTAKKIEFLHKVKHYIKTNPFSVPMDRDAFNELLEEKISLEKTISVLIEEKDDLLSLVNDLKKAKDRSEVTSLIKKRTPSTQFQQFEELCDIVKELLSKNARIINGIIFNSYTDKGVSIGWEGNNRELDEAVANDYIDKDLDAKWYETKEMKEIKDSLDNVSSFLSTILEDDFYETYEQTFKSPIDIKNKKFWEEAFEASISFT
jgi:hypothetical protein